MMRALRIRARAAALAIGLALVHFGGASADDIDRFFKAHHRQQLKGFRRRSQVRGRK